MSKITFATCLIVLISIVQCQDGQNFCTTDNIQPVEPNLPLPIIDNNAQYQASIERNSNAFRETEELVEYYDGLANIGVASEVFGELNLFTYSYYQTNELIIYYPYSKSCYVYNLSDPIASYLNPFPVVDLNGTNHILSPLNSILNNKGFKFVYIGKSEIRGIPVDQWQTCSYSRFELKTYNITISFSDKTKWKPAQLNQNNPLVPSQNFESIPIEIRLLSKLDISDKVEDQTYSVTKFKPFLDIEIEDYETPSGVYCEGRINRRKLPELPKAFSFFVQQVEPYGFEPSKDGMISHIYEEYNYYYQLFEYAFDKNNSITREVHDFNTGLKYVTNDKSGECEIRKIGVDDDLDGLDTETSGLNIKLKDPKDFFSFDPEKFQFTGYKRRDGVNTEVWIGPKNLSGFTVYYEWYFLSQGWNRTDFYEEYQVPIYLKVFLYLPIPNSTFKIETRKSFHLFDFRENDAYISDFDISKCDGSFIKDFISFSLIVSPSDVPLIQQNLRRFKSAVTREIVKQAKVTILRVAKMEVRFRNESARIYFTLYEQSEYYGNVPKPENDVASSRAIKYLNDSMIYNEFAVDFRLDNATRIEIDARNSSIRLVEEYQYDAFLEGLEKDVPPQTKDSSFGSGTVAGITILMLAIGLAVGLGLVLLEKNKKIQVLKPLY